MPSKNKNIGIEHCWSILCKKTILDSETNDLSIMSVVDKIQFQVPSEGVERSSQEKSRGFMFPIELEIVSKFKKTIKGKPVAFDHRLRFLNSKGEQMGTIEGGRLAMDEKTQNLRIRGKLTSFPVEKDTRSGDYEIIVEVKDVAEGEYTEVNKIPLEVEWSEVVNKND